jgi:hypothetical protein
MKHKIGDLVPYGVEHYNVVGLDLDGQRYYLEQRRVMRWKNLEIESG